MPVAYQVSTVTRLAVARISASLQCSQAGVLYYSYTVTEAGELGRSRIAIAYQRVCR